jgi:hypothetical protein
MVAGGAGGAERGAPLESPGHGIQGDARRREHGLPAPGTEERIGIEGTAPTGVESDQVVEVGTGVDRQELLDGRGSRRPGVDQSREFRCAEGVENRDDALDALRMSGAGVVEASGWMIADRDDRDDRDGLRGHRHYEG